MESSNSSFLGQTFLACGCSSHCLFLSARRFECELTVWNWNLDVAFLKMQWTDSWIAECLEFFIRSLTENLPLLTLIGPCRKAKITADYVQIPWAWPRGILPKMQKRSNAPCAGHAFATNPLLSLWVAWGSTPRDGRWYPHNGPQAFETEFADALEVQKHLLADGLRPIKEAVWWTSFSFFPDCFNCRKSLNVCFDNQVRLHVRQFQAVV